MIVFLWWGEFRAQWRKCDRGGSYQILEIFIQRSNCLPTHSLPTWTTVPKKISYVWKGLPRLCDNDCDKTVSHVNTFIDTHATRSEMKSLSLLHSVNTFINIQCSLIEIFTNCNTKMAILPNFVLAVPSEMNLTTEVGNLDLGSSCTHWCIILYLFA